jgi:hypothetical protein
MSDLPREVPGGTTWERAVNLAGLLAERGIQKVIVKSGGEQRELDARASDLPNEIQRMISSGGGIIAAPGRNVWFLVGEDAITTHE